MDDNSEYFHKRIVFTMKCTTQFICSNYQFEFLKYYSRPEIVFCLVGIMFYFYFRVLSVVAPKVRMNTEDISRTENFRLRNMTPLQELIHEFFGVI